MKIKYRWIFISLCLFISGCNSKTEQDHKNEIIGGDLRVENQSNINIYPTLINKNTKQKSDYGVVSIGKYKVKGFGPFIISHKITIIWEEGESDKKYETEIDTAPLFPIDERVTETNFIYKGKSVWIIQTRDREDNVYSQASSAILK